MQNVKEERIMAGCKMTNLRELRKAAGLTQAELAAEAKTMSKVISRFETGERSINIATLIMAARIAKALGVHAEDLIDD